MNAEPFHDAASEAEPFCEESFSRAEDPRTEANHPPAWFSLEECRVTTWIDTPPPSRRWLIDGVMPANKNLLIVAPGGTSKSMFAVQLALSIATGKPFLNRWSVGESGAVLLLAAEDDRDELHRRFHHAAQALTGGDVDGGDYARQLIKDRIFAVSLVGQRNLMTGKERDQVFQTERVCQLIAEARKIPNLRLIVIDPLARFQGGQENASDDVTRFVETLEQIVQETGAGALSIHHANKASMMPGTQTTQAASRGSSALTDGVRWQGNLSTMSEQEARRFGVKSDDRKKLVQFSVVKNNYGPPISEIWLRRGDHGVLSGEMLETPRDAEDTTILARVIEILRREFDEGREFSKNGFEQKFGGISGELGCAEKRLRFVLTEAVGQGVLELRSPQKPTRSVREVLAVVESDQRGEF
ncbi:MAG: AAA family ATPase [Magnetococcales bacterium]|nr:AAA family ATPase [Magnetococcales bacterium]